MVFSRLAGGARLPLSLLACKTTPVSCGACGVRGVIQGEGTERGTRSEGAMKHAVCCASAKLRRAFNIFNVSLFFLVLRRSITTTKSLHLYYYYSTESSTLLLCGEWWVVGVPAASEEHDKTVTGYYSFNCRGSWWENPYFFYLYSSALQFDLI